MDQELDLRVYWNIFLRWWWIFALGFLGAGLVVYVVNTKTTPLYEASAKILVQRGVTPGTPSLSDIQASQQLAQNYGDLIKTRPILQQVVSTLALPYNSNVLASKIVVQSPRSLIEITVTDSNPEVAAQLANTTAQTFINDFQDKQLLQIAQFQASLSQYNILQDPSIIAAQAATMSTLRMAEAAIPPWTPSSPKTQRNVILGMVLGMLLAGLVVFILEYLNDTIKSPDELRALTGLATLGSVLRYPTRNGVSPVTYGEQNQHSAMAESYRFLRTNLQFAAVGTDHFDTLLITSSSPEEGKTTTAANLAICIAEEGKSVILVDSDLRKPALRHIFDLKDRKGLTHLILGEASLDEVLTPTQVDTLKVIPSGPIPPDATQILSSPKMKDVVKEIKSRADLVIFDSPPILAVTDPMILASHVDGVLLVVDIQRTARDTIKRSSESLKQASPGFINAVLNKVSTRGRGSGYYYYYYYYGNDESGRDRRDSGKLKTLTKGFKKVFKKGQSRRHRS